MKHLVQILLPATGAGGPIAAAQLEAVLRELTERFGGVTAYTRTPAQGLWKHSGDTDRDTVVMVEVVVDVFDPEWWATYRLALERTFRQAVIHTRAFPVELI
jgi:hypothetical protein